MARTASRPSRPPRSRRGGPDQSVIVRRAIAVGAVVVVVLLLGLGVKSCLDSSADQSLRDYTRSASGLIDESDQQVGEPLFEALSQQRGGGSLDRETQVNELKVTADSLVDRAERLDTPDEMQPAQRNLVMALDLRAHGISKLAQQLGIAAGEDGRDEAIQQIAGQMQAFLASDVLYSQVVYPNMRNALADASLQNEPVPRGNFLPDLGWLDPQIVAQRLGTQFDEPGKPARKPAPGPHGTTLETVTVNETPLVPDTENAVTVSGTVTFSATFLNDANEEQDVVAKVELAGGGEPIVATKTIPTVEAAGEATVDIPLPKAPPTGTPLDATVSIEPVPGEETTDNNSQSFTVTFER